MEKNKPPKWKMAILMWIAIYPLITLIFFFFGEQIIQLPLVLRTLVLTLILVPSMVYILVPFLSRVFRPWLIK